MSNNATSQMEGDNTLAEPNDYRTELAGALLRLLRAIESCSETTSPDGSANFVAKAVAAVGDVAKAVAAVDQPAPRLDVAKAVAAVTDVAKAVAAPEIGLTPNIAKAMAAVKEPATVNLSNPAIQEALEDLLRALVSSGVITYLSEGHDRTKPRQDNLQIVRVVLQHLYQLEASLQLLVESLASIGDSSARNDLIRQIADALESRSERLRAAKSELAAAQLRAALLHLAGTPPSEELAQ